MKRPARSFALSSPKGFTLVELLIVISIIAVLAVVGVVAYRGVTSSARDAKRKADIEAIAKSYEVKQSSSGSYSVLTGSDFASGIVPTPPEGGTYFSVTDGSGAKVCVALEANPSRTCNSSATNCYCLLSTQGTITNPTALSGSHADLGVGGGGSSSCDTNGTLLSGLVGYWKMDEGSGAVIADSSGNGNQGDWTVGGTWGVAKTGFGSATTFNGTTDFITIPYDTNGKLDFAYNQNFTVSVWLKNPTTQSNTVAPGNMIVEKWNGSGGYPYAIRINNQTNTSSPNKITVDRYNGTTSQSITSPTIYNDNAWHLVTFSKNGSTLSLYIDGTLKGTKTDISGTTTNSSPLYLGSRAGSYLYQGSLDDLRIYNRALLPAEVAILWNSGNGCIP